MSEQQTEGRVLLVDDDEFMCEALTMALRSRGFEVESRHSGHDVATVVEDFQPEMVVLDLNLSDGIDGVLVARRLRDRSSAGLMFISGSHRLEDRLAGFAAGGDDFLTKPFAMAEFFARVDAIRNRVGAAEAVEQVGGVVIDERAHRVTREGHELALTPIEFTLLATLARNAGRVLSKTQLLDLVWGFDRFDVNLVEVHVHALRQKLEVHGPRLIQTVRGLGYVFREE
jgi:two-component system OmpR family response regulator